MLGIIIEQLSSEWLVCVMSELRYKVGNEELRCLRMRTGHKGGLEIIVPSRTL
jgi:hypothetical protein